jgi:glutamate N-acetyltransferase/amino-acid N-acetyltransferase
VTPSLEELSAVVGVATRDLAEQLAADAEGASRVVTIDVSGAVDDTAAREMGRAISDSALVRSAFYGGDPNWGRLAGALGAGPHDFDPADLSISFAGVEVARGGVALDHDEEGLLAAIETGSFTVEVKVGSGDGTASILTTDLTPAYVEFNGERS